MRPRWWILTAPLFVVLALVVYWDAPGHARLPEDDAAVWSNSAVTGASPIPALLGQAFDPSREGWRPVVRPVATLWQRILWSRFHQDRAGYQWVQIVLLGLVGWLFFLVLGKEIGSAAASLGAALLLIVHPLATAPVLTLAGCGLLLAAAFLFLGLLVARVAVGRPEGSRWLPVLACGFWLLAGWSHEISLAALPAVILWALNHGARAGSPAGTGLDAPPGGRLTPQGLLLIAGVVGILAIVLVHRALAFSFMPEEIRNVPAVLPTTGLDPLRRFVLGLAAIPTALRLIFLPAGLGYAHDDLLHADALGLRAGAGAVVLLLVLAILAWSAARRLRGAPWLAWTAFGVMAAVNLPIDSGTFLAEGVLLFPLIGILGAGAAGYLHIRGIVGRTRAQGGSLLRDREGVGRRRVADAVVLVAVLAVVALLSVRSARRVEDYSNWESLIRTQVEAHPGSAEGHFDLGNLYLTRRLWSGAIAEYEEALERRPDLWMAAVNLGAAYIGQQENGLALRAFERVLEAVRGNPEYVTVEARAEYNRALVLMQQNRNAEAAQSLQRMLEVFPDHLPSHANLGLILANADAPNLLERSEFHLRRAMELENNPERREVLEKNLRRVAEKQEKAGQEPQKGP